MQARLEVAAWWSSKPNVLTHKPVAVLSRLFGNASPFAVGQEWLICGDGANAMLAVVSQQHIMQVLADWRQPAFVELGLANGEDAIAQIDIVNVQRQGFTDAKPATVQQQQERSNGGWAQQPAIAVSLVRRL